MSFRSMFFNFCINFTLSLLFLSTFSIDSSSGAAFISGSTIKCFNEGEEVKIPFLYEDPCIRCKCRNQEITCERDPCSHLNKCSHNGKTYKSGDQWRNGTCNLCTCSGGEIKCQAEICQEKLICSSNQKLVHRRGDCCPSCQEIDGECSLTFSPLPSRAMSLKTFDGRSFPFNGLCNYVFAREVGEDRRFSIHVIHDFNGTSRTISSTLDSMAIVVKVEKVKVRLMRVPGPEMWKIRVGRQETSLPYIKLGILSVIKTSSSIQLRSSNLGFKVVWTKKGEFFLSMSPLSKSKVAGLCGNYDGDSSNDLASKKGHLIHSIDRFINSWKVGKKSGICSSERKPVSRTNIKSSPIGGDEKKRMNDECGWEKKVEAINRCNILKSSTFSACHRRVSLTPYFKACINEVCSCQDDKNNHCHCSALDSYVIQCQMSGIKLPPVWKSLSSCDTNNSTFIDEEITKTACPKGAIFTSCVNPCPRSCNNMTDQQNSNCPNKSECKAGCDCSPGLVWNINRCVHPRNCKVSSRTTALL